MPERSVAGVLAFAGATEASPVSADGTPRAQAVSPRPANLWDILNDSGTPTVMSGATVVVQPATSAKTVVTERPAAPIKTALAERPATPAPATKTAARPTAPALMPMTKVSGQEPPVARREIPMTPAYLPSFNPMEMTNKPAAPTAAPAKLPEAMPTPILKTPEPQMPSPAALKMPDISALPAGPPPMILTGTQGTQPKVSITTSVPAPLPVISSGAPAPAPAPNSASAPAPAASGPQVLVLPPPALPAGPKTVTMPAPIQTPAPSMLTLKAPEPTPMVVPQQPVVPARQTEAAPVRTPTPEARQALVALTGGATAQERQQAAGKVMRADLVSAPELVRHLMTAAQSDNEEPDTRVACIRALVRCQVRTPAMMAWLDGLSNDEVGPVRVEAIIGQARLRTAGSAATANPAPR
jgi:hypothetical protein